MADKADKKPDAAAAGGGRDAPAGGAAPEKKKGGFLARTPVMLGGVMLLEAAVLFAGFKFLGSGPAHAGGATIMTTDPAAKGGAGAGAGATGAGGKKKTAEVAVLEFKAQNKLSGRTFVYDVSI